MELLTELLDSAGIDAYNLALIIPGLAVAAYAQNRHAARRREQARRHESR